MGDCYNSILVKAPAEKVWAKVRNFHDMSWATGVVEKTEVVGDVKGDQVGARRVLNDVFHETVTALDDGARTLSYQITDGPGPLAKDAVKNYIGTIRILPVTADGSTFVEWTSAYESADDGKIAEFCNPIYMALLGALQKSFA